MLTKIKPGIQDAVTLVHNISMISFCNCWTLCLH